MPMHFPDGLMVQIFPESWAKASINGNLVTIEHTADAKDGRELNILIVSAKPH